MKKAFTLVEMLVVIGILGVLMAIILANLGGATESANAAKCMSNMRSLYNAANSIAMGIGYYPTAGTNYRSGYNAEGEDSLSPFPGWISYDRGINAVPCYGTGSRDEDLYALTNGTSGRFWQSTGANAEIYRCPTFTKNFVKKRHVQPLFSYVMNAGALYAGKAGGFVSDSNVDWQSVFAGCVIPFGSYNRADRMVMFAELPIAESCEYDPLSQPETCDCALQFNMKIGGKQYGNPEWKGRSESIGFVHQDTRKRYFGHVIFVDGHVERMVQPPKSGLKADVLTAHVCCGDDCAMEADGYRLVAELEEEEE